MQPGTRRAHLFSPVPHLCSSVLTRPRLFSPALTRPRLFSFALTRPQPLPSVLKLIRVGCVWHAASCGPPQTPPPPPGEPRSPPCSRQKPCQMLETHPLYGRRVARCYPPRPLCIHMPLPPRPVRNESGGGVVHAVPGRKHPEPNCCSSERRPLGMSQANEPELRACCRHRPPRGISDAGSMTRWPSYLPPSHRVCRASETPIEAPLFFYVPATRSDNYSDPPHARA